MTTKTYQDFWPFWLDEACYQVARGVRALAVAGEADAAGCAEIRADKTRLERLHNVTIRLTDDGEVLVARYPWVLEILDAMSQTELADEVMGLLLGYSPQAIETFRRKDDRP